MTKLETITAEDLQNRTYEPTHFLVDELIPEGLHILAGAPKIGKSWLALWLCLCVSQGQPLWNFAVTQGEVLYLSLEDSYRRIQSRLFDLTEDAPPTLHFAILADTLKHGLEHKIEQYGSGFFHYIERRYRQRRVQRRGPYLCGILWGRIGDIHHRPGSGGEGMDCAG